MGDANGENSMFFGEDEDQGDKGKLTTADKLVTIAESLYEFGISTTGEAFAVPRSGPRIVYMLRGGRSSLRAELSRCYRQRFGKVAGGQALADAMLAIEGIAQEAEPADLHLRVARHDGATWLDLGDDTGRAVRIGADGRTAHDTPPVLFKRTALTGPLPAPVHGGDLAELWTFLNVADEDRPLILAARVASLNPDVPHVVLGLTGEQGTGKTTAEKVFVTLLDPSPVPVRKAPKDAEAWVTAAAGSWVVGLDNLSYIPDWLSDSICRASTGEGDVRRKLYTDGDLSVFAFRRCVILNGIDFGAVNGDLAERTLWTRLEPIDDDDRLEEDEFWPEWADAHPRILGALLDLAAASYRAASSVHLGKRPRMADYAKVLAAVDQVLDTAGLARYVTMQGDQARGALTGDVFIMAAIAAIGTMPFEGTSADLLELVDKPDHAGKSWPTTPRKVTTRLRRWAPVLRKAGWSVTDDGGRNHDNAVRWSLAPPLGREGGNQGSQGSQHSRGTDQSDAGASHASYASNESGPLYPEDACPDPTHSPRFRGGRWACPDCEETAA